MEVTLTKKSREENKKN